MNKQEVIERLNNKLDETFAFQQSFKPLTWAHMECESKANAYMTAINYVEQLDEPQKVKARLAKHWDEDLGDCLWWDFPVEEPPYCGTPLDDDFPRYKTHFTELHIPDEVEEEPKWVVKRKDNGKYVESLALGKGIGLIAETTASLQENAYKLNSKDQADAVAVLIDGTVEKV